MRNVITTSKQSHLNTDSLALALTASYAAVSPGDAKAMQGGAVHTVKNMTEEGAPRPVASVNSRRLKLARFCSSVVSIVSAIRVVWRKSRNTYRCNLRPSSALHSLSDAEWTVLVHILSSDNYSGHAPGSLGRGRPLVRRYLLPTVTTLGLVESYRDDIAAKVLDIDDQPVEPVPAISALWCQD